jgi:hypothetical protein
VLKSAAMLLFTGRLVNMKCRVLLLILRLVLRRSELLLLSSNTSPQPDGRNFYQFGFDSHHHHFFLNWLGSLNCTSKARHRANCGPRKEPLKG